MKTTIRTLLRTLVLASALSALVAPLAVHADVSCQQPGGVASQTDDSGNSCTATADAGGSATATAQGQNSTAVASASNGQTQVATATDGGSATAAGSGSGVALASGGATVSSDGTCVANGGEGYAVNFSTGQVCVTPLADATAGDTTQATNLPGNLAGLLANSGITLPAGASTGELSAALGLRNSTAAVSGSGNGSVVTSGGVTMNANGTCAGTGGQGFAFNFSTGQVCVSP